MPYLREEIREMKDYLRVGVVSSTHGIKGEVKIFPTTDDPNRFKKLKSVILDLDTKKLELEIEQVRFFKQFVILKWKGLDKIEDVEGYKGKDLLVERKNAIPLEKDEYFIVDLIGLKIITEDGTKLGTLIDVIQTGANDVYVIKTEEKEILLPAIKECILQTDIEAGIMKVHIMEGLLNL